ncbi:MAG: hypothetical protein Harvfovirus61_4 [Harvfovirus sp.]|uniref:Uncharacterized protein n=1 Tax=Harvfovirus sp. TaxID=2487768 RepID=A0A3G5A6A9_9VIRU|nr:MAG: hypothetical protein Harvfovirus61_4 [Harvfovirus sp.]
MAFALSSLTLTIPNIILSVVNYPQGEIGCDILAYLNISAYSSQFLIASCIVRSYFTIISQPISHTLNHNGLITTILFLTCYFLSYILAQYSKIITGEICFFELDSPISVYLYITLIISALIIGYYFIKVYRLIIGDKKWFAVPYLLKIKNQLICLIIPIILGWILLLVAYSTKYTELLMIGTIFLNSIVFPFISIFRVRTTKGKYCCKNKVSPLPEEKKAAPIKLDESKIVEKISIQPEPAPAPAPAVAPEPAPEPPPLPPPLPPPPQLSISIQSSQPSPPRSPRSPPPSIDSPNSQICPNGERKLSHYSPDFLKVPPRSPTPQSSRGHARNIWKEVNARNDKSSPPASPES